MITRTIRILLMLALVGPTLSVHAADTPWTRYGPPGGIIHTLEVVPTNPTTIYAGTDEGGVFKSIDRGHSWFAVTNGLTNLDVYDLVVDPFTPSTLYAATGGGVHQSTDGGATWSLSSEGLTNLDVRALTWDNINFTAGTLTVRQGKTDASWNDCGLVFPSSRGTPLSPRNLLRHFKALLRKAGLPETIRFHDLRHSCATLLLAQGVEPHVVKDILGHSHIAVTMDMYGHVLPATQKQAIGTLKTLFE